MHILIVRNNSNSQAVDASLLLATYLGSQGIGYTMIESSELSRADQERNLDTISDAGIDMAVVLGGDGTILRTARLVNPFSTPILGINFGRLGFLANASDDGVVAVVAAALAGDVVCEHRTNLQLEVAYDGDDLETFPAIPSPGSGEEGEGTCFFALNEIAISRGAMGRIIDFNLAISGTPIAAMRGDGIVVATATGSTAYALSAGGPLVSPGYDGLVVVPVAPHTLHSRSIVTAANDVVEIDLTSSRETREATLFTDGEKLELKGVPARVCVRKGNYPTVLLRYKSESFYRHIAQVFF